MNNNKKSVLVIGFNTRPIATSLNLAGYKVYAVDFFGDEDLYPYVEDSLIFTKEVGANYEVAKEIYQEYLLKLSLKLLKKHPIIDFLIIGSGLDDAFDERIRFFAELKKKDYRIKSLNNDTATLKKARDIQKIYTLLEKSNHKSPVSIEFDQFDFQTPELPYPVILKKKQSSGGINVYKIDSYQHYLFLKNKITHDYFEPKQWWVQEYVDGLPISCTVISDGVNVRIISINRQILGESFLNAPKEYIYCGNIVPANLLSDDDDTVAKVSIFLTKALNLKGINGFDYVLKDHQPYLMEVNPRIPGSLSVSESALGINLMELHVQSFSKVNWNGITSSLDRLRKQQFATKLVLFASQTINSFLIKEINKIKYVHDKTTPDHEINKGEPVCTVLYTETKFANSYFGALKIVDKIERLIRNEQ